MLSNEYLRRSARSSLKTLSTQNRRKKPLKRSLKGRTPSCILRINKQIRKSWKDFSLSDSRVQRRLLLTFDSSLKEKSLTIFDDTKFTVKICSMLSKLKGSKDACFRSNGLFVSQQKGHYHIINDKIDDSNIQFTYIRSPSLVKGIANREIGSNFVNCNNGYSIPPKLFPNCRNGYSIPSMIDEYKKCRLFFTNDIFETLHLHPYRRRLFSGRYIVNHLHCQKKKEKIRKLLGRYEGCFKEVAEFWWSLTSLKFKKFLSNE